MVPLLNLTDKAFTCFYMCFYMYFDMLYMQSCFYMLLRACTCSYKRYSVVGRSSLSSASTPTSSQGYSHGVEADHRAGWMDSPQTRKHTFTGSKPDVHMSFFVVSCSGLRFDFSIWDAQRILICCSEKTPKWWPEYWIEYWRFTLS
jgi:hypothetical protein